MAITRIDDETIEKVRWLAKELRLTQQQVIERAVSSYHAQELYRRSQTAKLEASKKVES